MKKFNLATVLIVAAVFTPIFAQDGTRSITSSDFTSQRPNSAKPKAGSKKMMRPARYKFTPTRKPALRRKSVATSGKPRVDDRPAKTTEIGITLWRMRRPLRTDKGPKLQVKLDSGDEMWTPERVNADTVFKKGDRVRMAIEPSVSGYLYVINREILSTGGFGRPLLIFPADGEDNSVKPGMLIDIPDRAEDYAYFLLDPQSPNYSGEMITVIVSPQPLSKLAVDSKGYIKDLDYLDDVEEGSEIELYARTDTSDKLYTDAEVEAGCGAKTRELAREKTTEKPCGAKTRQLTREEPAPQAIYRVRNLAGQPVVAFVTITVR